MKNQRGFTLLELMLVIGLSAIVTMMSFYSDQADLEQKSASEVGNVLFQYNNGVRSFLAKNNGLANSTQFGSAWLKNTTCGGPWAVGAEYLPCNFPAATAASPIKFGRLSLSTSIVGSGAVPNRKVTATTTTSAYTLSHAGTPEIRSDLSGIAAITASSGGLLNSSGTAYKLATDASYSSNPLNATITMTASNNADQDIWLRTDGGNSMHANLNFDSADPASRQITGASRIQNLVAQALYLGSPTGIAALSGAGVVVDANTEVIGNMRIRNTLWVDNGVTVTGSVSASGSVIAQGNVSAAASVTAGGDVLANANIAANGNVSAAGNVSAGGVVQAQLFYDSNNTGYYVDPAGTSSMNSVVTSTLTSYGRVNANEYLAIGGYANAGSGCYPNGLLGRDAIGAIMSCQNGIWASNSGGVGTPQTLWYSPALVNSTCLYMPKNIMVTVSAPGDLHVYINGSLIGHTYSHSGRYVDVATDASISHVAAAGTTLCAYNNVVDISLGYTEGMRIVGTPLN
jgi:prepilin-type N-terminal cleavage/methylation domain-containing protein